jgi:exosortase/archaeosortase family protein
MRAELNARVGRTLPTPLFGALVPLAEMPPQRLRWPDVPQAAWLPAALLAALWPHWLYVARRMVDGSDEPWGALALASVIVLMWRDRAELTLPPRAALAAAAALALLAAAARFVAPDLAAAAIATLAVGTYAMHSRQRPAPALIALLLLALPLVASLQFYFGYPLRLLVAHASSALLTACGLEVSASGASLLHRGQRVLIDAPCAGIGMLWLGSYVAALLSYLHGAGARTTLVNGVAAALLVMAANILRNTVLFFPEAGLVQWPAWSHAVIGLSAFVAAIAPLTLFIIARSSR